MLDTLVRTDTTHATGSCTAAADGMASAMVAAGFPAADLHRYAVADHPREGGLVAVLPGRRPGPGAALLVAHLDTVPADAARWRSPPFTLAESDGYWRGRGVADDKGVVAILVESFIRLHRAQVRPARALKLALTCGEETATAFNGAHYLATAQRALIAADLVLVPSGGATMADGRVAIDVAVGEKAQQNFTLSATGVAGNGSRPAPDNAIYRLARALTRLAAHRFPISLNPVTRAYLARVAADATPAEAGALRRLLAAPDDPAAAATVTANPAWNGMLRTTCVATAIETGRQLNTVPARASANVNCRLLPGASTRAVGATLAAVIADPDIAIAPLPPLAAAVPMAPSPTRLIGLLRAAARPVWGRITIGQTMLTGATDAHHFNAAGLPAYGVTVLRYDADGNGVHADDERIGVRALAEGRAVIEALLRRLARSR